MNDLEDWGLKQLAIILALVLPLTGCFLSWMGIFTVNFVAGLAILGFITTMACVLWILPIVARKYLS